MANVPPVMPPPLPAAAADFSTNGTLGRIKIYPTVCTPNGDDSAKGQLVQQLRARSNDTEDPPSPEEQLDLQKGIQENSPPGQENMFGESADKDAVLQERWEANQRFLQGIYVTAQGPIGGGPGAIGLVTGAPVEAENKLIELGDNVNDLASEDHDHRAEYQKSQYEIKEGLSVEKK